jgi:hypothetical protein
MERPGKILTLRRRCWPERRGVDRGRQFDYSFGCSDAKRAAVGVTVIQRVLYREGPSRENSILKARGLHLLRHPKSIFLRTPSDHGLRLSDVWVSTITPQPFLKR